MYEFRITGCGFDMRFVGDFVASILGVVDVVVALSEEDLEESVTELSDLENGLE